MIVFFQYNTSIVLDVQKNEVNLSTLEQCTFFNLEKNTTIPSNALLCHNLCYNFYVFYYALLLHIKLDVDHISILMHNYINSSIIFLSQVRISIICLIHSIIHIKEFNHSSIPRYVHISWLCIVSLVRYGSKMYIVCSI